MNRKVALITGITGQDGSYLAEFLLEKDYDQHGRCIVRVDPRYFRPTEVESLLGDPTKARLKLGWVPRTSFPRLVQEMVREDLKLAERDALITQHGYRAMAFNE